ncbi:expressed unknown protein [Seminavis robusta]|uniref:G-protein coupled receptors family 1 profile domain-containing protein n=1 Tax=Seminavis robusta TaxID=568900 RepID=A0A9N8D5H3_9STRA|nr:expressed unknown protein [Seminavis robusta]|eukprot:Sro5_g004380.1 n/a (446) ;mRNA; r:140849-142296
MSSPTPTEDAPQIMDEAHYIPLMVIGTLTSTLSLLGSLCIIYMVSRDTRTKIVHRILFGMSVADCLTSACFLLMPYLIPSYIGLPGAVGSHASCSAIGFFFLASNKMGCIYNAFLSMYYYLVVVRNWREHDFRNRPQLEIVCHTCAIVTIVAIETTAVATQSINPSPMQNNLCIYAVSPWGCNNDNDECSRSNRTTLTIFLAISGVLYVSFSVAGFACTVLVWLHVRTTLKRSGQYRFENSIRPPAEESSTILHRMSSVANDTLRRISMTASSTASSEDPNDAKIRQVAMQAILYSLVCFQTIIWPLIVVTISSALTDADMEEVKLTPGFYVLKVMFWICYPLQGFLNFFVFTRPKVKRWREVEPNKSCLWIFRQVVACKTPTTNRYTGSRISTKHSRQFKVPVEQSKQQQQQQPQQSSEQEEEEEEEKPQQPQSEEDAYEDDAN